ncbi:auxin-binding protein, partial [Sinorhizobium meliloti]
MTDAQRPIVNPKNLKLDHWRRGSFFESSDVSFGALLGLKDIG